MIVTEPNTTASRLQLYINLIRWDRPAGWLLLLWPSLTALWIASKGSPSWHLLLVFVLGTILMRSAGCCINDVADREFDKHVKRTAQRPVTSGQLSVRQALQFGALLALCAFALVLTTNAVTVVWSFAAVVITIAYPYAKRFVAMPQAVLGIAFSFGIPMAFSAVRGGDLSLVGVWDAVELQAWLMLFSNLFWVLAYDTEYAMVDRDDDLQIGIQTSAITLAHHEVKAIVLFYVLFLISWMALVMPYQLGWPVYVACTLAFLQVIWHFQLIKYRNRDNCFKAFRQNHWLCATLFAGVVVGFAFQ
jgi:4-hydroxybenzoate polyprenyltransferase